MLAVAPAPAGPGECANDVTATLRILARLRGATLCEVIDEVMDTVLLDDLDDLLQSAKGPSAEDLPPLVQRFDRALGQVLELLPYRDATDQTAAVMRHAGRVVGQPLPDDYASALGHLRRVAVVIQHGLELLDQGGDV